MKIDFQPKAVAAVLANLRPFTGKRSTMEVLSHVLVDATGDTILMRASNIEAACDHPCPGRVLMKGKALMRAEHIAGLLAKVPESAQVSIEWSKKDGGLMKMGSRGRWKIPSLLETEALPLPTRPRGHSFRVRGQDLRDVLEACTPAAATTDVRIYMNGTFLKVEGTDLVACSTDGHRLHLMTIKDCLKDVQVQPGMLPGAILPIDQVPGILKLLPSGDAELGVRFDESAFEFGMAADGPVVNSRCIAAGFVDYERVLPAVTDCWADVAKDELGMAIERAMLILSDERVAPRVVLSRENGTLVVAVEMTQNGAECRESIDVKLEGAILWVTPYAVNPRYLLDSVRAVDGDAVRLQVPAVGGAEKSAMRVSRPDDPAFAGIIMGVR